MRRLFVLSIAILCFCSCGQSTISDRIIFYDSDGTWCLFSSGDLAKVSSEKVYVADDMTTYSVYLSDYEWGILHSDGDSHEVLYEEPLIFDGDKLGRPVRWASPTDNEMLLVVKNWIIFYVFDRDTNALHLCKIRVDGSDYYEYLNYEFRGDPILSNGDSVYSVCENVQGDWVPTKIDLETNQVVELSSIPANIRDNIWIDCERLWWVSIHDGMTLLYSMSFNSNEVTSYPIGNVEYIGSKQIFYRNDSNILCSKNIETGKITTWNSTKAVEWSRIVGCSSQGVLFYAEETTRRVYWFMNFKNGSLEQLLKR